MKKEEITKLADKARERYKALADRAGKDKFSKDAIGRTLDTYIRNIDLLEEDALDAIDDGTFTEEDFKEYKKEVRVVVDETVFRQQIREMITVLKEEEETRKQSVELEKAREDSLRAEQADSPSHYARVEEYLTQEKNIRAVNAKELADTLFNALSDERKAYYFNAPMYAADDLIGEPEFEAALDVCLQRYHKSMLFNDKVQKYLDAVSPERDRDDYEIDKLIELLPDSMKSTNDTRMYLAYRAIIMQEQGDLKEEGTTELTVADIKNDEEVYKEFVAEVASGINHEEPYDVAYNSGFEKVIGSVAKRYGKITAMPRRVADVASQSLELGRRETLGNNLYNKVQQDKELEALLRARDEEREEYERRLHDMERRVGGNAKMQNQNYMQQNPNYMQQKQYGYNSQYGYNNQGVQHRGISMKLIGIGVNVGLLLLCLLADSLFDAGTWLMWIGLGLSTYGWCTMPSVPRYNNQSNNMGGNSKWLLFILGGYAEFILVFFLMTML